MLPNLLCHPSHTVNELTPKTGEVATMDKPFQCEHCDKCFSEYLTLSAHTDHYHGFSRRLNAWTCAFMNLYTSPTISEIIS